MTDPSTDRVPTPEQLATAEAELDAQDAALDQAAAIAVALSGQWRRRRADDDPGSAVEVLTGADTVAQRWRQARRLGATSVRVAVDDRATALLEHLAEPARDGVHERRITAVDVGRDAALPTDLPADVECRVLTRPVLPMLLVDDLWALVLAGDDGQQALLIHPCGLLDAMAALFERWWALAVPVRSTDVGQAPDDRLVTLLLSGLTDDAIARQLGISSRSCQRRVAALMERLGARSRFEAGVKAALERSSGRGLGA